MLFVPVLYMMNFGAIAWLLATVFPGIYWILKAPAAKFVGVAGADVAVLVAVAGTGLAVRVAVTVAGIDVAVRVGVLAGVFVRVGEDVTTIVVEVADGPLLDGSMPHTKFPLR